MILLVIFASLFSCLISAMVLVYYQRTVVMRNFSDNIFNSTAFAYMEYQAETQMTKDKENPDDADNALFNTTDLNDTLKKFSDNIFKSNAFQFMEYMAQKELKREKENAAKENAANEDAANEDAANEDAANEDAANEDAPNEVDAEDAVNTVPI
jgi:hypothetical protein